MKDNKKVNAELVKFWNSAIKLPEDYKEEVRKSSDNSVMDLVPAQKLFDAVKELGSCKKVLDYGSGSGWASFVAASNGCKDVLAVDLGQNIIDAVKFYADVLKLDVKTELIDENWIKKAPSMTYDGFVCSNVLDVVPLETAEMIIKEMARITTSNAKIIIGLNFYMSEEMASKRKIELVDGMYLFVNNVLRLSSLSDDEWKNIFAPYFDVVKLDYFAWEGEPKESRRLFILKKK